MLTQTLRVTVFLLAAGLTGPVFAEDSTLKEGAKEVGKAVGTAAREVGEAGKQVGKAVGDAAKEVGEAVKEGAKEAKRAVKKEK